MKTSTTAIALIIAAMAYSSSSHGDSSSTIRDAVGPGDNDSRWMVSGTGVRVDSLYAGEDDDNALLPVLQYRGDKFFTDNGTLNYNLGQVNQFTFGLTAGYSTSLLADSTEYADNPFLAGLNERDGSFEGGFYINHTTDLGRFHFSVVNDLEGEHDGQSAVAKYTFNFKAGDWAINPTLGAAWMSDKKANHLYGVSGSEALEFRPAYDAGPATNLFAGIRARYAINDRWDFSAETGVTRWSSNITDSSIVGEDTTHYSAVSLSYNF